MTRTGTPRRSGRRCLQIGFLTLGLLQLSASLLQPEKYRQPSPSPVLSGHQPTAGPNRSTTQLQSGYARLPLSFEANQGQFPRPVEFLARGNGYSLALNAREAVLSLQSHVPAKVPGRRRTRNGPRARAGSAARPSGVSSLLRLRLLHTNSKPVATPEELLPGKVNYLLGNDPRKWRTDVSTYGRVRYRHVYPGIDLTYYGSQRQLEYDFVVGPGADPGRICLGIKGARAVEVNRGGDLVLHTTGGDVVQHAPITYQEIAGERKLVSSRYVLTASARQVGFRVGAYDRRRPLVIDPVLSYSTYLGGAAGESAGSIAVDSAGSAYVVGATSSSNFPTQNAVQPASRGNGDVFISKLNPAGTALVYSTYLGGGTQDYGIGVAVDGAGAAYVVGLTNSVDFPTRNPLQANNLGQFDTFVAKLNPAGSGLVYSTYLGSDYPDDHPGGIAVTAAGEACITGWTAGANFPTVNPLQGPTGQLDAYVTKFNAAGSALIFSTYLGGAGRDLGRAIALDPAGNVYVTGKTESTDFPTPNGFQRTIGADQRDAFVAKLTPNGSALLYSTYLGGSNNEDGTGIAADADGNAYAVGDTSSLDFPTQNPFQPTGNDFGDVYVTKLNPTGAALVYSTYLGGSQFDECYGAAVDRAGNLYVSGDTESPDFPVVASLQGFGGIGDAFVAQVNPSGTALVYNTYLGGTKYDFAIGVAVDPTGNAYALGTTSSTDFPTLNAFQPNSGGGNDAFVVKLNGSGGPPPPPPATHFSLAGPATVTAGDPFSFTLTALDAANTPVSGYTGTVHFTSTDPQAELPPDYTFTAADSGAHAFTAALKTAGPQTLTATDTAMPALKGSAPVTVTAGAAVGLRFGQQPTNAAPGAAIAPPVTVRIVDAFGNTVPSASNTVSLTLGVNPSGAVLNGTVSAAAASGIAAFSNLSVDKAGNGYTLAPSASGLTGPFTESAPFNVIAKPATHFRVTAPANASSGSAFEVNVTALDADNKTATGYTGSVRWTSSDPQAVLPPDYTFTAGDAGAHVFTVTLKTVGSKTITVTDKATASINGTATVIVTEPVSFVVTTAADTVQSTDGVTSLREAILAANAHAGLDTITFKIPGSGLKTLAPTTALPTITDPVIIDGYTQPGAKVNTAPAFATNAVLMVEISGAKAGKGVDGLTITAGASTVKGLAINRFQPAAAGSGGVGIVLKSAGGNGIAGCFLGTSNTGTAAFGNATGVLVEECPNNTIGGSGTAVNLISGNATGVDVEGDGSAHNTILGNVMGTNAAGTITLKGRDGVDLEGLDNQVGPGNLISGHTAGVGVFVGGSTGGRVVTGNLIIGNRLGTDTTGTKSIANANGIYVGSGATRNQVGGTTAATRNVISGNNLGLVIVNPGGVAPSRNLVQGNYIGTDLSGAKALPNATYGVWITAGAHDNLVGGDAPGARNVISGNKTNGISIEGVASTGNRVQGNFIGMDVTGNKPLGNGSAGMRVEAPNTVVGGTTPEARNVVSGNPMWGVRVGLNSAGTVVQGNYVGTNAAGTAAFGALEGVNLVDSSGCLVGGTSPGAGNLISGNGTGVLIFSASGETVQGNLIGTNPAGTGAIPNGNGAQIIGGSKNNLIGGDVPGARNLISGNKTNGIRVADVGSTGNRIQGNYIGLDFGGANPLGNGDIKVLGGGVVIESAGNTVGGRATGARNVISGNPLHGVLLYGASATGNSVQGNYLGTDATGTRAFGNNTGVTLGGGASKNVIGGGDTESRNLISGNVAGVLVSTASSNQVLGNYIGTDITGAKALANSVGIQVQTGSNNNILGAAGAGNLISGNSTDGVQIRDSGTGSQVQGNYIGTNAAGGAALPNGANGVSLLTGATKNLIGGTVPGARNILSGNIKYGALMDAKSGSNTVQGNYFGTDATGSVRVANFDGLHIFSSNNLIGGATPGAGNVISGSDATGVLLTDNAANNVVQGNRIGTNAAGTAAIPNIHGVYHRTNFANTIGGLTPLAGNLISGNLRGVNINGSSCTVLGNRIGTDADGTGAIPNTEAGCKIVGNNNTVGGTSAGSGNLLSGNGLYGAWILDGTGNKVQGNFAGTNAAGTAALPNGVDGVNVSGQNNLIGGTTPAARNLLSGNHNSGVAIVTAGPKEASGNLIQGNYIGTDVTGMLSVPNHDGVFLLATSATVGGTVLGAGNLISGNLESGVALNYFGDVIQSNLIGTNRTGLAALPNKFGITVLGVNNTIGGAAGSVGSNTGIAGNRIAYNLREGVTVIQSPGATPGGNGIRGNLIYANGGLGIDLEPAPGAVGPTPNDPLDKDLGPNGLQNYPVVTDDSVPGALRLTFRLNSTAKTTFVVDFYRSTSPDPSGFGGGEFYAGTATVTTDSAGNATTQLSPSASFGGQYFTATATRTSGGGFQETSEFSNAVRVPGP